MAEVPRNAPWGPLEFPQLCRFLTERSPQPTVAVEGANHIVRYANPAFRLLLGNNDHRLIGRRFAEAVPEGMANGCAALLDRVFDTGTSEGLTEQGHDSGPKDATALPSSWSYLAWAILGPGAAGDETVVGVMIQVTDAAEIASFRRNAVAINEALLQSGIRMHELAYEEARLNAELRMSGAKEHEARLEAQAANRSKEIFLATLSHELRTPLNAILGWAVLLRMKVGGGLPIDAKQLDHGLAVIERNARAQAKLIDDVLDMARVASGKFQLDCAPCDLDVIVLAAVDAVRPAASIKSISLDVKVEPVPTYGSLNVMADSARLSQAVLNLLSNAVKFTPQGGGVTVCLERTRGAWGEVARVVVSDNGQGIRPEFLPFVFDRFKQADAGSTRMLGGLGLGLAIVRQIADLHGGIVTAESDGEGRGATFTLELPLPAFPATPAGTSPEASTPGAEAGSGAPPVNLDGIRVLLVDDDEDARIVAGMALATAGAAVVAASSAEQAFQLAVGTNPPPHILVSDIAMPREDGYSLIRRLRDSGVGAQKLPAVALTALSSPEDPRRALGAEFQVYVQKPVDPRALVLTVARLAGRQVDPPEEAL